MKLEDLKKSVSEMSDEELEAQIMGIRESRRSKKKVIERKKKTVESSAKKSMNKLLAGLSPEEVQLLLNAVLED